MNLAYKRFGFLILIVALGVSACGRLQPGYYLTPDNYPTERAGVTQPVTQSYTATADVFDPTLTTAPPAPTPTFTETSQPTSTPIICDETEGLIITDSFISQETGNNFGYRVYLPPCYAQSGRRFPTLIMMHGLGAGMDDTQWDRMGLDEAADREITDNEISPLVIIMPDGTDANYADTGGTSEFPDIIVEELMPLIERQFCTWNLPSKRAIGGLSRGGFWAYWIAFSNPDLFGKVGGHSPYFYRAESPFEKNPTNLVDTVEGIEHLSIYFDHGPDDYPQVLSGVSDFVERLEQRGFHPFHIINPAGGHTEEYWSAHIEDYLEYYTKGWPLYLTDLPSCHDPSPSEG